MIINANRHEGTSRAVLEVAERLAALGHDVDLIARTFEQNSVPPAPSPPQSTGAREKEKNGELNWIRTPGPRRPEFVDFASFKWSVDRRLAGDQGYDIVHSAGPNTRHADVYTIQTVHPIKVQYMSENRAEDSAGWHRRASWWAYDRYVVRSERQAYTASGSRGMRAFLPVSVGTMQELLGEYPNLGNECRQGSDSRDPNTDGSGNIHVIPNGADLHRFTPDNRPLHRSDIRRQYGVADDDFLLIFSGGDWRRKGLDLTLQAIKGIEDPKIKLLVVGHDRAGADVRRMSDDLGLQSRVTFTGFCSDVHRYYAAADLFVFPTSYEAFSLASIEAAASGLPVLMPAVSGAAELIGSNQTGTIIRRDPEHIAEVIMEYFRSPAKVAEVGMAARRLVEERFNWDAITDATLAVYRSLLQQREKPS